MSDVPDTTNRTEQEAVPRCLGVIMDGNRRWARARGLPTIMGHQKGYEKFHELIEWCVASGVLHVVVYAFSSENWNRSPDEVAHLMELMRTLLKHNVVELQEQHAVVRIVGDLTRFPQDIQESVAALHATPAADPRVHVWICASYGGRAELCAAFETLRSQGTGVFTEDVVTRALWTAGMPDPDLIIRLGGQQRLSNFLLWQAAYSELLFLPTLWPDFSHEEFTAALTAYAARNRRYGI